jgi:hypothetical protein
LADSPEWEGSWFAKGRKWRWEAVKELWLAGWAMKDISGLAAMPLVEVAKIIGGLTRSGKHLQCREDDDDSDDGFLRSIRLGPAEPALYAPHKKTK